MYCTVSPKVLIVKLDKPVCVLQSAKSALQGSVKSVYVKLQGFRVATWYSLDESWWLIDWYMMYSGKTTRVPCSSPVQTGEAPEEARGATALLEKSHSAGSSAPPSPLQALLLSKSFFKQHKPEEAQWGKWEWIIRLMLTGFCLKQLQRITSHERLLSFSLGGNQFLLNLVKRPDSGPDKCLVFLVLLAFKMMNIATETELSLKSESTKQLFSLNALPTQYNLTFNMVKAMYKHTSHL